MRSSVENAAQKRRAPQSERAHIVDRNRAIKKCSRKQTAWDLPIQYQLIKTTTAS
jgi:hypothetical protein